MTQTFYLKHMSKNNLVIVESPAKAKTIEKILGQDFVVMSSFGHIRDLPKKGLNIDKEHNFEPIYEIPLDKKKVIAALKKAAVKAQTVWLASDEDREGEAIAWHLCQALKLPASKTKRIAFHEITQSAVKNAIKNPRDVDIDLVNAQQARRVLDRLVGYELSPILWKKVQPGLSAGRVQSIAVKLIVDREREIKAFEAKGSYKTTATFKHASDKLEAELDKRFGLKPDALKFLEDIKEAKFSIKNIADKPSQRNPGAPFTTSMLQQEASRKLGFSVKQTMSVAQRLYEAGHITYMRTDSTNVSEIALKGCEKYIVSNFGKKYHHQRHYRTKNSNAQEAHEAIRPTDVSVISAGENTTQDKLYKLIWKRMVSSQMAAAETLKTEATINTSNRQEIFVAKGEVLKFDGFYKVWGGNKDDAILPKLAVGDVLELKEAHSLQIFSRPPARFSEASLVKTLEELGIGRPSTYAPIISTIQSRGYIERGDLEGSERQADELVLKNDTIHQTTKTDKFGADQKKLLPTHLAEVTTDFLSKYFTSIMDSGFTAGAEKQLDSISEGKLVWQDVIKDFYGQFHPQTETASNVSRHEASQARLVGKDPASKQPIYARFGRYGPMLQRGEVEDKTQKPDFATMPKDATIETVTLEQALKMFSLPREVGKTEDGQVISANSGRFGPYIKIGSTFVSIKPHDPFTIDEKQARQLYKDKLEAQSKKQLKLFKNSTVKVLAGPYGPYVTDGKKNTPVPKKTDPAKLTLKQATELLAHAKPRRRQK